MFNTISRAYRDHYLAVGPNFADKVEWNLAQAVASTIGAGLAAFAVYIGPASAWAVVATL